MDPSNSAVKLEHQLTPVEFGQLLRDIVTPTSLGAEPESDGTMPQRQASETPSAQDGEQATGDKKPAKKRKSWGQQLPEPKTNLPPRKRAKTEDEKEQRRVERVLRNRRAAQSSRERKRQETEALEKKNKQLLDLLVTTMKQNEILASHIQHLQETGAVTSSDDPALQGAMTLAMSKEILNAQHQPPPQQQQSTVDPAALSPPALLPDTHDSPSSQGTLEPAPNSTISPDVAQCPAETLFDLPCHMSAERSWSGPNSLALMILSSCLESTLAYSHRALTQIALSLKTPLRLAPSPHLLATMIWLVTIPRSSSTTLSARTSSQPSLFQRALIYNTTTQQKATGSSRKTTSPPSLRLKSLRKILTSSPNLARPLQDATLVAMRLVSEKKPNSQEAGGAVRLQNTGKNLRGVDQQQLEQCLRDTKLPSRELLMTLYWAIHVESKRLASGVSDKNSAEKRTLKGSSSRRPTNREAAMKKKVQERYHLSRRSAS